MNIIQYKEIEKLKEFKKSGNGLVWSPFVVDEFMGFTKFRIRVANQDGDASRSYTEEYVMGGSPREKACNEAKYINRMKGALKDLLTSQSK